MALSPFRLLQVIAAAGLLLALSTGGHARAQTAPLLPGAPRIDDVRPKAEAGDADAQFKLGLIYENGIGVEASSRDAFLWYEKAMRQGHAGSMTALGDMYFDGSGSDPDPSMATFWYLKAAAKGHALAQAKIGYAYAIGLAVQQDTALAYYWLTRAVRAGEESMLPLLERVKGALEPDEAARARVLFEEAGLPPP